MLDLSLLLFLEGSIETMDIDLFFKDTGHVGYVGDKSRGMGFVHICASCTRIFVKHPESS